MFLEANGPFNLAHTLESGQSFRWRREPDGWFVGIVGGSELRVREAPGGAEFSSRPQPEGTMAPIVRSYLRLDDDLGALYKRWREDVHLTAAVEAYRGLRLRATVSRTVARLSWAMACSRSRSADLMAMRSCALFTAA